MGRKSAKERKKSQRIRKERDKIRKINRDNET